MQHKYIDGEFQQPLTDLQIVNVILNEEKKLKYIDGFFLAKIIKESLEIRLLFGEYSFDDYFTNREEEEGYDTGFCREWMEEALKDRGIKETVDYFLLRLERAVFRFLIGEV